MIRPIEAIAPIVALVGPGDDPNADGAPLDEFARADAEAERWAARQAEAMERDQRRGRAA